MKAFLAGLLILVSLNSFAGIHIGNVDIHIGHGRDDHHRPLPPRQSVQRYAIAQGQDATATATQPMKTAT